MTKFTRDYYKIFMAAKQFSCDEDYLLHLGAINKIPVYIISKGWSGLVFDNSNLIAVGDGYKYDRKPEPIVLRDLVKLFPGTVQLFEGDAEEIAVTSIRHSDNPETGEIRQVELMIQRSHLFVKTADCQNVLSEMSIIEKDESEVTLHAKVDNDLQVGVNNQAIATAFENIYWTHKKWLKNLSEPSGWLNVALITQGTRGGPSSTWNPVLIAVHLQDKEKIPVSLLNTAFRVLPLT